MDQSGALPYATEDLVVTPVYDSLDLCLRGHTTSMGLGHFPLSSLHHESPAKAQE